MALSKVDDGLRSWLGTCPDAARFASLVAEHVHGELMSDCAECGDPCKNKDLRVDDAYFQSGVLICEGCYTFHNGGTPACPDYHAEWPAASGVATLYDGEIWDGDKQVGVVLRYNPLLHFGERVELFTFPECGEGGTLDESHEVRNLRVCTMPYERAGRDAILALLNE
jgi:hypothetical protein